jgi:hypothetical protein
VGSDGRCVGQGVGTAKGSDRSSRGADVCVVQAVDEDWRLGGEVLDQIKHDGGCGEDSCAQAGRQATDRPTGEASRQGCSSQQARNRRDCNAGGREWLRLEHYYGLYMHNITPSHLQLTAMIDGGKG